MSRLFRFAFRSLSALFALIVIAFMLLVWRLTSEPLSSTSLTPYVESGFARLAPDSVAQIASSTLAWDNERQTLTLSCQNANLYSDSGAMIASFPDVQLRLSVWGLLRGRVLPLEMKADKARFWITRHKDGSVALGEPKPSPSAAADSATADKDSEALFGFLQTVGDEIANKHLRHTIEIKDAVFAIHDETIDQDWTLTTPILSLQHDKATATGEASLQLRQGDRSSALQVKYDFERPANLHEVAIAFQDIRPSALASQNAQLAALSMLDFPLTGKVAFGTDRDLNIASADIDLNGGAGTLTKADLWDKPRSLSRLAVAAHLDQQKHKLVLTKAEIDFGGPKLSLEGEAGVPPTNELARLLTAKAQPFSLTVKLDNLPMDQFADVWPKTAIPNARAWIVENMTKGLFTHGEVTIKGKLDWDDPANMTLVSGGGKIAAKDGRVTYMPGMPAIENVSAEAGFDLDQMSVKILGGHTGAIKLLPFVIHMTDFQKNVQYIAIPVHLMGPVREVLKLIDEKPLGYAKAVGLDPDDGTGQVDGTLTLKMPMLDSLLLKDVDIQASAKLTDFGVAKLIPHIEVSQGNLALDLTKDGFGLKGPVALNKVPAQLIWKSRFGEADSKRPLNEATVTATIKDGQWAAFGLDTQTASIIGETPVSLTYANMRKGFSRLSGTLNLKQAEVGIDSIGWDKPAGTAARLNFSVDLLSGKNIEIKTIDLQGAGIRVKGDAELDADGSLRRLALTPFALGRSNANIRYIVPADTAQPIELMVQGEALDISGLGGNGKDKKKDEEKKASDEDKARQRPKIYDIQLIKLYTDDNSFISSLKGRAERGRQGWDKIDVWGLAQGVTPFAIKLAPQDGGKSFSIKTDNFGVALQGLGFGKNVKGGDVDIAGSSKAASPYTIEGKIKIGSFSVSDLPILARLLNAVSPFGFVDLITGDSSFSSLRGDFRWQGDRLELSKVRAPGSVVGINLDGHVDLATDEANLNGTVVPFSMVNSILGMIPLLGDVITGGEGGGVVAASFSLKGPLSDMDLSVNPVSLLTPGFLRNLFFSADETPEAVKK